MKNLKLELFNYKKNLPFEHNEVSTIVEGHMNACGSSYSDKEIIYSLNEKLKAHTYDKSVRNLLESLNGDVKEYELLYELKHLYSILNRKNQGEILRQPINVLLEVINCESDSDRMSKVLNELSIYNWVPEIKVFVSNLTKSPEKRNNLLSGGKCESVCTIVERVEDGFIALVKDSWFLMNDDKIEKTLLENHVTDNERFNTLRALQTAMELAYIANDRINFKLTEGMTIGISLDKKGDIYINDDKLNNDSTLESVFSSPIVPLTHRNYYPLLVETAKNIDKFYELDVVKKITNLINPTLECYAFNYEDSIYLYNCDERYGYSFYNYTSANELINEIASCLNYDLTFFYENKLETELVTKRKLEDKEREITLTLEDVNFNISKIKSSIKTMGNSEILTEALDNLNKRRKSIEEELLAVRELQYNEKIKQS